MGESGDISCKIGTELSRSWSEFAQLLIPPTSILLVIGAAMFLVAKYTKVVFPKGGAIFILAFCVVGAVPGIVAGYSQQAIAGTFLTATVGIVSTLLSFAFAKDSLEEWRPVIPFAMIVVVLGALSGFTTGGVAKDKWVMFDQKRERAKFDYENLWAPVEKERRLKNLVVLLKNADGPISAAALTRVNMAGAQPLEEEECAWSFWPSKAKDGTVTPPDTPADPPAGIPARGK